MLDVADGFGNRQAVFPHAAEMHLDGLANLLLRGFSSRTSSDAAWEIGNIGRIVPLCLFDDNGVADCVSFHFFRPACLRMLFNVPGGRSSLGFPATVTRPTFLECLNWRWLPSVATRYQPSDFSKISYIAHLHA